MSDTQTDTQTQTQTPGLVELSISGVLQDLANGLKRKEIGEKYHLDKANRELLFRHPKLMGKKAHPKVVKQFTLVDDAPNVKEMAPIVRRKKDPAEKAAAKQEEKAPQVAEVASEGDTSKGSW